MTSKGRDSWLLTPGPLTHRDGDGADKKQLLDGREGEKAASSEGWLKKEPRNSSKATPELR